MAFDFPNSPSTGSTHSTSGATYVYDGEKWVVSTSFTGTINIEDEIPAGTISSSAQIEAVITDAYISSSVNSSNIGFDGNYDNLNSVPIGIVSSSAQITALGFVSESVGSTPAGTISGSSQITALGFVSESGVNLSVNTFTESIQSEVDSLTAATSSYLTSLPSGTISGSAQITALGFVSESGINLSVNTFTESIQSEVDSLTAATSSYLTSLPSGTISGSAQIDRTWTLGADGSSNYTFTGPGLTGTENDPTLYLTRGETYRFVNQMGAHPFRIQSDPNGSTGTQYNDGVTNNDVSNGTLIIDVQFDAPSKIYYQCTAHASMGGVIEILDKLPEGVVSGSVQITSVITDTYISSSAASSGFGSGGSSDFTTLTNVPSGLVSGSSQLTSSYDTRYLNTNGDGIVSSSAQITDGSGILSGSVAAQLPTGTVSGSTQITNGSNIISGSTQIANLGYVSSSTVDTIQVMTAAAYSGITPVSGVLYIIQG
jgi:plastocyanin